MGLPTHGPLYELAAPIIDRMQKSGKRSPEKRAEQVGAMVSAALLGFGPGDERDWDFYARFAELLAIEDGGVKQKFYAALCDYSTDEALFAKNGRYSLLDKRSQYLLSVVIWRELREYLVTTILQALDDQQMVQTERLLRAALDARINACLGPNRERNRHRWELFGPYLPSDMVTWRRMQEGGIIGGIGAIAPVVIGNRTYWVVAHRSPRGGRWDARLTALISFFAPEWAAGWNMIFELFADKPTTVHGDRVTYWPIFFRNAKRMQVALRKLREHGAQKN